MLRRVPAGHMLHCRLQCVVHTTDIASPVGGKHPQREGTGRFVTLNWLTKLRQGTRFANATKLGINTTVQLCSEAKTFAPLSLGTNELRLNHTRSIPQSDLQLQCNHVSAILRIIHLAQTDI
jgi:hypothetical protein